MSNPKLGSECLSFIDRPRITLKGNYKILTGVVWEWNLSLSSFLYFSIMNTHFYKGKEIQFKENRGLSCCVGNTAPIARPGLGPNESPSHAAVTGEAAWASVDQQR